METCAREIGVGEVERRGSKGRSRKKKRRKGEKEKVEERENNGNKKIAEKWEIWDEEEEVAKSEAEVKKLVPERFHR